MSEILQSPPVVKTEQRVPSKRIWVFPWVLLAIWSGWFLSTVVIFLVSVNNYMTDADGFVVTYDQRAVNDGPWMVGSLLVAALGGVFLGALGIAASIICYFFFPKPTASR